MNSNKYQLKRIPATRCYNYLKECPAGNVRGTLVHVLERAVISVKANHIRRDDMVVGRISTNQNPEANPSRLKFMGQQMLLTSKEHLKVIIFGKF